LVFHDGVVELGAVDFDFSLERVELEGGRLDALLFAAEAQRLHGEGVVSLLGEFDLRALASILGSGLGDLEPLTGQHLLADLSHSNWDGSVVVNIVGKHGGRKHQG
jgi:phosphoribosylaminoimidazole (AIR) synthetase